MPVTLDNPAGRLHAVFSRFVGIPGPVSIDQAWSRALGCPEGDAALLGEELTEVASLLHECIAAGRSLEASGDAEALLHELPSWSSAIFGFGRHRSTGIQTDEILPSPAMSSLATLAMALHLHVPEWTLKPGYADDLESAREQLSTLKGEIAAEELIPEPIRARLSRTLGEALDSFRFLDYRGLERLARDIEAARRSLDLTPESRDLCTPGVLERIDKFALRVSTIAEKVWSKLAPPIGAIYLLATGDVMGGATIMASNPQVAGAIAQIGNAIRENTKNVQERQLEGGVQDDDDVSS